MLSSFKVEHVPVAQPRPRISTRGKFARAYLPKSHPVHEFKEACEQAGRRAHPFAPLSSGVGLRLDFLMPRPRALQWKRKPMPRVWHTKKPDIDNLSKAVIDALTGVLWVDDSFVCQLEAEKWTAAGDERPGVLVNWWEVSDSELN